MTRQASSRPRSPRWRTPAGVAMVLWSLALLAPSLTAARPADDEDLPPGWLAPGPRAAFVAPPPPPAPEPVVVNGRTYDAYIEAATKQGQFFLYTCEFDAAWVVLKTFGHDVPFPDQLAIVGHDTSVEPYAVETANGYVIYGGDITTAFSGDYTHNLFARASGAAFQPLFEAYGLRATPVHDRAGIEEALRRGKLIWMKATVDFLPWEPVTWVTPDGDTFKTVLGNDHAVVAIGYNAEVVVIRDVLGPTDTNWGRQYTYEVPWATFLAAWGAQSYDGLAVGPPSLGS